jgi:hypothetical protein
VEDTVQPRQGQGRPSSKGRRQGRLRREPVPPIGAEKKNWRQVRTDPRGASTLLVPEGTISIGIRTGLSGVNVPGIRTGLSGVNMPGQFVVAV